MTETMTAAATTRSGRKKKGLYVDLSPAVVQGIRDLAESNRRAIWEEVEHALERHLGAPPRLVVPEMPGAELPPAPRSRGGRQKASKEKS